MSMPIFFIILLCSCNSDSESISLPVEPDNPFTVQLLTYTPADSELGSSDASGSVAIDKNYMIVADDEANVLRVYPRNNSDSTQGITGIKEWDYRSSAELPKELDVEALTWYQPGKLLVVGSHSNKKDGGEAVSDRGHIFAVNVSGTGINTEFEYISKYSNLESDLILWDKDNVHGKGHDYFGFSAAAGAGIAPENVHGFSIEGASISLDGSSLLLGFRAPLMDQRKRSKAIVVPVLNFLKLIDGSASIAEFGLPLELDLGGRGIRDISKWNDHYLIVSGPSGASRAEVSQNFALFKWLGGHDQPILLDNDLETLRAKSKGSIESIVQPIGIEETVQLLLDNGDSVWPGKSAVSKDLPASEQMFQGAYLKLGSVFHDQQPPNLIKQVPIDGTVGVNTDTRLELIFDEGIKLADGVLQIYQGSKKIAQYTKNSSEVSIAFNRIVIRTDNKLDYSKIYSLRIEGNFVVDHAGNSFNQSELGLFVTAGEPTHLDSGDIQFVAANAEAPDAIAFVLMKSVNGGTQITFTDRDYYSEKANFWNRKNDTPALNEGVFKWTADRNLNAGDIITIQTDTTFSPIADMGQVVGGPSGLGKEETIYAMVNTVVDDLTDGTAGSIIDPGKFLAAITLGGQTGSDIPSSITNDHLSFTPVNGKSDQTNAIFDVKSCGRDVADIKVNLHNTSCWKVTYKSEGASGFPLFDSGSLFEQPRIN